MKDLLEDEAHITLADGEIYTLAAIPLDDIIEAESLFADIGRGELRAARDAAVRIVGFGLKRRHPEITLEEIGGKLLTIRNMGEVIRKVMAVSGLKTGEPLAGEATAGQA